MSSGKWASKDLDKPEFKEWKIGNKVKYQDGESTIKGVIVETGKNFVIVKTQYGYKTCFTYQAAQEELRCI